MTLSAQARHHLSESRETNDFYESALALQQVLDTILVLTEGMAPDHQRHVLQWGPRAGILFVNVLAAEMLGLNMGLCIAFQELGMWELIGERVSDALELVGMSAGRFHVAPEGRRWLREMERTAEEQVRIDRGDFSAVQR